MSIVNRAALIEILGINRSTAVDWAREGMPVKMRAAKSGQSNEYDTADVIEWMVRRKAVQTAGEAPKDRLARVQADRVELDIAEKIGKLVPVDSVEPMWAGYVTAARQQLRAEPPRLAHLLEITPGVEAKRELLEKTFDDFLRSLAGIGRDLADDLDDAPAEDDEEDFTAAEGDGS